MNLLGLLRRYVRVFTQQEGYNLSLDMTARAKGPCCHVSSALPISFKDHRFLKAIKFFDYSKVLKGNDARNRKTISLK